MDFPLDLPPLAAQPPSQAPAEPFPAHPPPLDHNHPPYAEMITAAISELNERNGSSKRAIAGYIEANYPNLPPAHPSLLTDHLGRLKDEGQVVMVKQSYKLPGSAPTAVNGSSDPAPTGPKRRPGRPPKPKPDAVQAPVPVFAPSVDMNSVPAVVPAAVGPVNGPAPGAVSARGRGRPPKRGPGRPPKVGGVGSGKARGRPKKSASLAARKGLGRPRGRPPKAINLSQGLVPGAPFGGGILGAPVVLGGVANVGAGSVLGGGAAPVLGKRRGRPPKAGGVAKKPRNLIPVQPKKPRKLSGKPLGRPRKPRTQDSQLLVAYLDLKAKLENLQTRIKQAASFIKPSLNSEVALNALQELEMVATNVVVPSNAPQSQQQQPLQPQP